MVKKVTMFKKKCSVCIFLIYNGSKPKHFLFDIYSTTVELMAINGCIAISRFVPFFVRVLLLTLLRSELIISILCDVAYPWESLVSTLFNDLQISHLYARYSEVRNLKFNMDRGPALTLLSYNTR